METFAIAPAASRTLLFAPLLVVLILVSVVFAIGRSVVASRTASFEVATEGIRLRGDWYGRLIPADQVRPEEVRAVDLNVETDLRPRWRTLGTGLPGYQSGWFRLANGERALLYLTDRGRAVYVPTSAGYSLLLSPADPHAFVAAVRRQFGK